MLVGLYLRHIKTYKNIHYIPIGNHNFVNYLGRNGSGKSSIIEALDTFFNGNREYLTNNTAYFSKSSNSPYCVPIFLIDKTKITSRNKNAFATLSDLFWNMDEKEITNVNRKTGSEVREFFKLRESLIKFKDTHFLIMLGETSYKDVCMPFFENYDKFREKIGYNQQELQRENDFADAKSINEIDEIKDIEDNFGKFLNENFKSVLDKIKKVYSYVYIPVESSVEDITKIETISMQKLVGKTLKDEIMQLLNSTKFEEEINKKLNSYVEDIEKKIRWSILL